MSQPSDEDKIREKIKKDVYDELEIESLKERVKPSFLSRIKNAGLGLFAGFILGSAIYAVALTDPHAPGYFSVIPFLSGITGALIGFGARVHLID